MLARHWKPMEISSPALVLRPLWQATQRSEVRNCGACDPCPEFDLRHEPSGNGAGVASSARPNRRYSSPAFPQFSVCPVPQHIEGHLRCAAARCR